MFIKHGDGKILTVIPTDDMTDEQKKSATDLSKKKIKQADDTDSSEKNSGR